MRLMTFYTLFTKLLPLLHYHIMSFGEDAVCVKYNPSTAALLFLLATGFLHLLTFLWYKSHILKYLFIFVFMSWGIHVLVHAYRSEDNFWVSVLSFCPVEMVSLLFFLFPSPVYRLASLGAFWCLLSPPPISPKCVGLHMTSGNKKQNKLTCWNWAC